MNDLEPLAVALKFGFLAVLYLFLLWVTRMALRDLRGTASPGFETGYHDVLGGDPGHTDAFLVVQEGGVHYGVIRVHPEGIPDTPPERMAQIPAQSTVVTLRPTPNAVGKVRKFWGEFF